MTINASYDDISDMDAIPLGVGSSPLYHLIKKNEQAVERFCHANLCWSLTKSLIGFLSITIH